MNSETENLWNLTKTKLFPKLKKAGFTNEEINNLNLNNNNKLNKKSNFNKSIVKQYENLPQTSNENYYYSYEQLVGLIQQLTERVLNLEEELDELKNSSINSNQTSPRNSNSDDNNDELQHQRKFLEHTQELLTRTTDDSWQYKVNWENYFKNAPTSNLEKVRNNIGSRMGMFKRHANKIPDEEREEVYNRLKEFRDTIQREITRRREEARRNY